MLRYKLRNLGRWRVLQTAHGDLGTQGFLQWALVSAVLGLATAAFATPPPTPAPPILGVDPTTLSKTDAAVFTELAKLAGRWNHAGAPLVRDYLDPNVPRDRWVREATGHLATLRGVVRDMQVEIVVVENPALRDALTAYGENYKWKLRCLHDIQMAVARGDAMAEEAAQRELAAAHVEARKLIMVLLEGLRPYVDAASLRETFRSKSEEVNELMRPLGETPRPDSAPRPWTEPSDPDGQYRRGLAFVNGHGVPKDETAAAEWFRKAATQGHLDAQVSLGFAYATGVGVRQDMTEAREWFLKAATREHAVAQYNLGLMYYQARGVPKDDAAAVRWFRKAAVQGHGEAQAFLAGAYLQGWGVPEDPKQAREWLLKAAAQGSATAQTLLGIAYDHGEQLPGIPRDVVLACAWYNLAAAQGNAEATRRRDASKSSSSEAAEAKRLAASWKRGQLLVREVP